MTDDEKKGPTRPSRRKMIAGAMGLGGVAALAGASQNRDDLEKRYPPLGDFETVEGARVHLLDRGSKDATAVVLIHGASGNLRDFGFGFSDRLLSRYRVIAVDRPGHGYSDRGPSDAARPDVQARQMRKALAKRGVERAILLGHSWGASAALAWALDAPETVIGVVDLAGAVMPWPGDIDFLYDLTSSRMFGHVASNAISAFVSENYLKAQIAGIFAPQSAPDGYLDGVGAALAVRAETMRFNGRDVSGLKAFLMEQSKRYPALKPTVEIVHGLADAIVPAAIHAEPLAKLAPKARLNLLSGVGHMPHHTAGEAVAAAVDRLAATNRPG